LGKRSRLGLLFGALIAVLVLGGGVTWAVTSPTTNGRVDAGRAPSIAVASTSVASATSTAPTSWHFEGRHSGIEQFQMHTTRCPVLDHHLQETFTLTDGTAWSFRARYCGTIDTHGVWTGVGSFVISAANGATLSGTFTDSAQLPSVGVPYELDIATGTGAFAGASGSCVLENHLRTIAPEMQQQEGIFVCDLQHSPRPRTPTNPPGTADPDS
jgi:hypothetical protein